ncbi:MAG: tetratricopeptide repeat protein [Propioniciclava sp.]
MTSLPFAGGAMDLSALKPAPPAPAGASWVTDADDQTLEQLLGLSAQHPLVVEFTSPQAKAEQLSADLAALANEAAGAYLHVRVNVDTAPRIVQALQIQAVPMVVGVLGGQLAPLFQGTVDKAAAKQAIDQLLTVAASNGVSGRAQPVAAPAGDEPAGPDPRFEAADAALAAGNFDQAVAEFDRLLESNPADTEASAGRAQAALLSRLQGSDADALRARVEADPEDSEAQLALADLELAGGDAAAAFGRVLELIRATVGDQRETARVRLLELFETVGPTDPVVLKARRELATALF